MDRKLVLVKLQYLKPMLNMLLILKGTKYLWI